MTPTDMEEKIRNLDRRLFAVEQILPNLATKTDLNELRDQLRREVNQAVGSASADAKRHTDIRTEDVRDDIKKIAEAVGGLLTANLETQKTLDIVVRRLDVHETLLGQLTNTRPN